MNRRDLISYLDSES